MKNSIFTIALLFGATIAFAQETVVNSNGTTSAGSRITTTNANANQGKLSNTNTIQNSSSNETKPESTNVVAAQTVLRTEKKHTKTGHVTLLK
jgi:hypothetical protein